jgi:hypothetical protein
VNERRTGLPEVIATWLLFAVAGLAVLVTYTRIPPEELYNTSVGGIRGGVGRTLVFLNYPVALAAVGVILICVDRLAGRRFVVPLAAGGIVLCALVPAVVDQSDLDARPVNVLPALGVAIAVALTAMARPAGPAPRVRGDRVRVVLAAALLLLAIPWLFAETGFYAPDPIYADERPKAETGEKTLAAVHLGFHHGTAGVELALVALLLSRTIPRFRHRRLAVVTSACVSLMLAYGLANAVQDAWGEQVVKRGWTTAAMPSVTLPSLSLWWALILAVAALTWIVWFRPRDEDFTRARARDPGGPDGEAATAERARPR